MPGKRKDYVATIGRRKSAIARVRIQKKEQSMLSLIVNKKDFKDYFNYNEWQDVVMSPLTLTGNEKRDISVLVRGGGIISQAEAIRMGIARALIELDIELRPTLKKAGYLKRDPRIKERKKPGLKKARRAPQWSKR